MYRQEVYILVLLTVLAGGFSIASNLCIEKQKTCAILGIFSGFFWICSGLILLLFSDNVERVI